MTQHFVKIKGRYQPVNPYQGLNEGMVIIGAVRYALGRGSYAPSCIIDFCRDHWAQFETGTRHVIMRDVLEWLGERHEWAKTGVPDMAWPDQWRAFLRWCMAQNDKDAESARRACAWKRDRMQGVDEFFGGGA